MKLRPTILLFCLASMSPALALAQAEADLGHGALGLAGTGGAGVERAVEPLLARGVYAAGDVGYGFMGALAPVDGMHHRAAARIAATYAPLTFMAFGLRLDGRLDSHPDDGMGSHMTAVGDPRLFARAGHALSSALALGFEAGVWLPGNDAPSFVLEAATLDARALLRYRSGAWNVLSAVGFRLDQSAAAAPDLDRMRPGDRQVLGLSDAHAALLAVALTYRATPRTLLFGELSADLLVGSRAPALTESPMRVKLGARRAFSDALAGEVALTVGVSARPSIDASDPLVPIEPRVSVSLGLRFGHGFDRPPQPEPVSPVPEPEVEPSPQAPKTTTIVGQVLDDAGQPLPEAVVRLRVPNQPPREVISDAQGRYRFDDVPVGPVEIVVSTDGFEPVEIQVDARVGMAPLPARNLRPKPPGGLLRGLARSFASEGLPAQVRVLDERGRKVAEVTADAQGKFELSLPPGRYTVMIDMSGYQRQRHRVLIEDKGVTVLNADLRQ